MAAEGKNNLPEDRLWQPVTAKWFGVIFGASLGYAILRYHIADGVSWTHFPLFILNKAVALAAVAFVACSYLVGRVIRWHNDDPKIKLVVIKFCGLTGISLAAIHVFFSVCLITPSYFAKFFAEDGRLNAIGEIGLAVGVIGLWTLAMPAITTLPMMSKAIGGQRWKRSQRMGYVCLVFVLAHLTVFGYRGWLTPEKWPAGLPPITIIGVVIALFPITAKLKHVASKRRQEK